MLLKHRPPGIDAKSVQPRAGLEHLDHKSLAVLRWLNANHVDYVVVGPVAHAIRGDTMARGPVAIVPAPYSRNWDRLARALTAEHAGLRSDRGLPGSSDRGDTVAVKLTPDKLARGRRWMLRFGEFDLDIEGSGTRAAGARAGGPPSSGEEGTRAPRYQELLYEANRFDVADGIAVEVASPEDLEHFSHVRRTGTAPEFRITRNVGAETGAAADAPAVAPGAADTAVAPQAGDTAVAPDVDETADAPQPAADAPDTTSDA
jgi:hypothetical protein